MAKHLIMCLHYRNIVYIIKEWHTTETYPKIYFYYSFTPMKFRLLRINKRFGVYERVEEKSLYGSRKEQE